jgi:site-specific recombinase XerD
MSADSRAVTAHLEWCRARNLSPATVEQRRLVLWRVRRHTGCGLLAMTPGVLAVWWHDRTGSVTVESRTTELMHVRMFYRWALGEGLVKRDPSVKLVRPRLGRRVPRPMAEATVAHLLAVLDEPVRSWVILAGFAGLRCGEIATLRAEHVRYDERVLLIHGKGNRQRIVPASPMVLDVLPPKSRGLYFMTVRGRPWPAHRVSQDGNRALHAAGVPETMHQLRHRFGTQVYAASLDLRLTQELMGHASPVTTAGYAAWSTPAGAAVVEQIQTIGAGR